MSEEGFHIYIGMSQENVNLLHLPYSAKEYVK